MSTWTSEVTGRTVETQVVPLRRQAEFQSKPEYQDPKPPTYTVTVAGGVEKSFAYDEDSLETPEEFKLWREYEVAKAKVQMNRMVDGQKFLLYNGVKDKPDDLPWAFDFALWGMEPPDPANVIDFKVRWIEEEVCGSNQMVADLVAHIRAESGVDEESLKALESFFRLVLEGKEPIEVGDRGNPSRELESEHPGG